MFIDSNTSILSSAAIEQLFFRGKRRAYKPKRSGLTDQNFEMVAFLKGACNQSMEF